MELFSDDSDNEMFEAGIFDCQYDYTFDSDSEEVVDVSVEQVEPVELKHYPCNARINYMTALDESEFILRFRLNKTAVNEVLLKITPALKVTSSRNNGVSPLHQLLLTLRFYALGTMLSSAADFIGVSKATAGRIVADASRAISGLYPQYVKSLENTQKGFHKVAGFPRVYGVIDCTHVPIQSPDSTMGGEFRNRKGVFSINVQAVCNADLLLMNVDAGWPGSTPDALIFINSELKVQCEEGVFGDRWLIGDSAYPCTSYLLTPLLNPSTPAEHRYNEAHIKTRNTIERCFSVWKTRFPVLSLKLRVALQTTQAIIIATSVLHNICRLHNIDDVEPDVDVPSKLADIPDAEGPSTEGQHNNAARQQLIDNYFNI